MEPVNYAYDEMSGFSAVRLRTLASQEELWLATLMDGRGFRLSRAARRILCQKKYIRVFYNQATKELLLASSNEEDENSVSVTRTVDTCINSAPLCRMIYQVCRYDPSLVFIRVRGVEARSRKGAIIFDLKSAKAEKPKSKTK